MPFPMTLSRFQHLHGTLPQVCLSQGVAKKQVAVGNGNRAKTHALPASLGMDFVLEIKASPISTPAIGVLPLDAGPQGALSIL